MVACLRRYLEKLTATLSSQHLFGERPTLHFESPQETCPVCGRRLTLLKTREKVIVTLDLGPFRAKETVRWCPCHRQIFPDPELRSLTPAKCTFGFDVLVYVGKALFLQGRNEQEIMADLNANNISISDREISYLGKKFVLYLAWAHQESQDQLSQLLASRGGYILHLDGTCEGDSPFLFTGLDGISKLVLNSAKFPSENADCLVPFLQQIQQRYGNPVASVHDMGNGILKAVQEVFPGIPDFLCHFHFLRDLGKDLLKKDYDQIRQILRKHEIRATLRRHAKTLEPLFGDHKKTFQEILLGLNQCQSADGSFFPQIPAAFTYALIHWVLQPVDQLGGYGFPFDRPHVLLVQRLKVMDTTLRQMLTTSFRGDLCTLENNWPFHRIFKVLQGVIRDEKLNQLLSQIEEKIEVFDCLRQAMGLALPEGTQGLNDDGGEEDMKTIEARVVHFREWITTDPRYAENPAYKPMIAQIDQYWNKLFTDPITVDTPTGPVLIQPQRTNNILERFFRDIKKGIVRKVEQFH